MKFKFVRRKYSYIDWDFGFFKGFPKDKGIPKSFDFRKR